MQDLQQDPAYAHVDSADQRTFWYCLMDVEWLGQALNISAELIICTRLVIITIITQPES